MTAFVSASPAVLSQRSSFAPATSTPSSTTPINAHRSFVLPKSSPRVFVRMTLDHEEEVDSSPALDYDETKLFVGNLAWATTEESLREAFGEYGEVIDARVITDRFTGKSRGFGFVEYDAASDASEALEGMNGASIDGRNVRVDRAASRQGQGQRQRPRSNEFRPRNDDLY